MLNVKLFNKSNFDAFSMIHEVLEEKGVQNILIITDNCDTQKYWESKNVRVELTRSIDDNVISYMYPRYKLVDTILITSPKLIDRYYNETVNVKVNKAREFFTGFNSNIYILSNYPTVAHIVSNTEKLVNPYYKK